MRKFLILIAILAMATPAMAYTFGSTTTTGAAWGGGLASTKFTPYQSGANTGTMDTLTARLNPDTISARFTLALFSDSLVSGVHRPGHFMDSTAMITPGATGLAWFSSPTLIHASIAANTWYHIGVASYPGGGGKEFYASTVDATSSQKGGKYEYVLTSPWTWAAGDSIVMNDMSIYATYGLGTPTPPDTLASCHIDSLFNDAVSESDSIWLKWTPKSEAGNDSVRMAYSTSSYPDSSDSSLRGKVYVASTADSLKIVVSGTETYTLYASFWVWDATNGWSTRKQRSRTFTLPTQGSLIGIIQ